MLVSSFLPHAFNLSFSRHSIVIFTWLVDIFHNHWILFILYFYFLILFLNINQQRCYRITDIESVTNLRKFDYFIDRQILINFLLKRANILI
jgi:hypothetical protein